MKIAIGSQNPVKIRATEKAFSLIWPRKKFEFLSVPASSRVSEQPMSDEECIRGAMNRANAAQQKARAHFGIGIEGGISRLGTQYFARAWIAVVNKQGLTGVGSSLSAPLPYSFMKLINQGVELGKATDILTGKTNTKHKEGYFGFASNNLITREKGYTDGIIMALARFHKRKFFDL